MNDYRRLNFDRRFEPSTASMGKFFSSRFRDSMMIGTGVSAPTGVIGESIDRAYADEEATPEPPANNPNDLRRSTITPTSTSSNNDSYFTPTARDIHKFSRRVELSSGYNILKDRFNTRPSKLTTIGQRRTPLVQLNPLPTTANIITNPIEDSHQRRMSFTDVNRTKTSSYTNQFNADGIRRPFSSDSPLPNSTVPTSVCISSAPPGQNRTAYDLIEPNKFPLEEERDLIADLGREIRVVAYPTTKKLTHNSPPREKSPSSTRYTGRSTGRRAPPRSLPKLYANETTSGSTQPVHAYHEIERKNSATEDRLQISQSNVATLLDQFFSEEPPIIQNNNERRPSVVSINGRDYHSPSSPMRMVPITNNGSDDNSMGFVSKYARLAPIASSQTPIPSPSPPPPPSLPPIQMSSMNATMDDTFHDFDDENNLPEDNFSYVPLKQDLKSVEGIPLLELDELDASSDISESQLVPIIYAKELANEIDLLQKAHLLKQQQRSMNMFNDQERSQDNNSVPPPANMEPLNFEALDEEFSTLEQRENTPVPESPTITTTMEISTPPVPETIETPTQTKDKEIFTITEPIVAPIRIDLLETSTTTELIEQSIRTESTETPHLLNSLQQSILGHNRLSPWYRLPTELWFKILPMLSIQDLHEFSYVCKRFYSLTQDHACQHRIVLNRRMNIEQVWMDGIKRRKPISLSFVECRQQDLENRQESTENKTSSNIDWLQFFQAIGPSLLEFTMSGCYHEPLTPNTLLPIIVQTCSKLRSLQLRWNSINDTALTHLTTYQQFIHLETLDLSGCQNLDDTMLINMFIRTDNEFQLKKLILSACGTITWTSLETIAVCLPNLRHLDVSRCINLRDLSQNQNPSCFSYWPFLEYVNFGHLLTLSDDDLMILFDNCQHLKSIILDHCIQLTDRIVDRFNEHLHTISVNNCTNLTADQLATLNRRCPKLQLLNVSSIKNVNDQCLTQWCTQPFVQLKNLVLDYCTDCTLTEIERFVQRHGHLQDLSLNGNIISTMMDRKRLCDRFSRVKIVFQ